MKYKSYDGVINASHVYRMSQKCNDKLLGEVGYIVRIENCLAKHDWNHHMPLDDAVHKSIREEILLYHSHSSSSHLEKNIQHFMNRKLVDIHFTYKLSDNKTGAAEGHFWLV